MSGLGTWSDFKGTETLALTSQSTLALSLALSPPCSLSATDQAKSAKRPGEPPRSASPISARCRHQPKAPSPIKAIRHGPGTTFVLRCEPVPLQWPRWIPELTLAIVTPVPSLQTIHGLLASRPVSAPSAVSSMHPCIAARFAGTPHEGGSPGSVCADPPRSSPAGRWEPCADR